MSRHLILAGAVLLFTASGCTSVTDPAAETEAIRKVLESLIAADNAGDLEGVLGAYADDAILLPPDAAPITGKDAIRSHYRKLFSDFALEVRLSSQENRVFGDWTFDRGRTTGRVVPRNGEAPREVSDNYLVILQRRVPGSWKIARLIWNHAPPGPP